METSKSFSSAGISKGNLINLESGRIPPQAIDLEEAVIGAMLIDKKGVDEVIDILTPEVFYKESNKHIFECIHSLFEESEPIDLLTVSSKLRKNGLLEKIGGDFYLVQLSKKVSTSAHIEFHARIIQQKFIQRSLIKISNEIINDSFKESIDVFDLLDEAESKLYDITQGNIKKSAVTAQNLVIQAKNRIEEIAKKDGLSGIATGFDKVDKLTSGWQPSDLIIIAARPGMGKTALALSMGRNAAVMDKVGIGMFSLEMANHQLAMRLLCAEGRVDSHLVRTGKLPKSQWKNLSLAVGQLAEAPIYLDDSAGMSVLEVRAKARRLKAEHNIGMIIVDYLQLMSGPKGVESRQQEISQISRSLKNLAKEIEVPVVALSQLSRAVEQRDDKKPQLSDLRESGSIEQDADVVMFVYREAYYLERKEPRPATVEHAEWQAKMNEVSNLAEIIIGKQRHGPTGNVMLEFEAMFTKFKDTQTS